MTAINMVSRSLCRMSAVVFVMAMALSPIQASECTEHAECGEDMYCINDFCETCYEDPTVCWEGEFCQYPDECFCDEAQAGVCKEGVDCISDGYPADGLGYCGSCDGVWTVCPTWPDDFYCSWNNSCRTLDDFCDDDDDCPNPYEWECSQTTWKCEEVG